MTALDRLNTMDAREASEALRACNGSGAWVTAVVSGRPYAGVAALLTASSEACRRLGPADVDEALGEHPRIGERASGDGAQARLSRGEQAAVSSADGEVRAALASANRAYEERFGRVFLIRAAGRAPAEILAELRRRLANDPAAEDREVLGQLCEITRLRLEGLVSS